MTTLNSYPLEATTELRPGDIVEFSATITNASGFEAFIPLDRWVITERVPVDTVFEISTEEQDGIVNGIGMVIGKKL